MKRRRSFTKHIRFDVIVAVIDVVFLAVDIAVVVVDVVSVLAHAVVAFAIVVAVTVEVVYQVIMEGPQQQQKTVIRASRKRHLVELRKCRQHVPYL